MAREPREGGGRGRDRERGHDREQSDEFIDKLVTINRVAKVVKKVLQSAIANAENNHQLDVDRLYVKEASVGKGLVMRRFHPRARGRASGIVKPFSHIVIIVGEKAEAA